MNTIPTKICDHLAPATISRQPGIIPRSARFAAIVSSLVCLSLATPALMGQILVNGGFETPVQTSGGFTGQPSGATWSFTQGGISASNGPWVPSGGSSSQFAYLQRVGAIMLQNFSLGSAGIYNLTYLEGARLNNNEGDVTYAVTLTNTDTSTLVFSASNTAFLGQAFLATDYTVTVPSAGNYRLKFEVTSVTIGSDNTALFDSVAIAIPEPSTYAAIFGSVALGGAVWHRSRRRQIPLGTKAPG